MSLTGHRERLLRKWLAEERARSIAVDSMLLRESQRHRILRRVSGIGRCGWRGR